MGLRGPVPSRDEALARPRSRKGGDQQSSTKGLALPVLAPEPDMEWHPIAIQLYSSLAESGQAAFYQQSDWAFAWSLCEDLSVYKQSGKRSGQMLQTIYSAMSNLLITEADRRRVRIELEQPAPEVKPASVAVMDDYRAWAGADDEDDDDE